MRKLAGLAALFAAGLLLAGTLASVGVADTTTTETLPVTTTVEETTTAPASTVVTTVEQTTTFAPTTGTTTSSSSTDTTPTWVWVVLGLLAAAVIGLLVAFLTRGRGGLSVEERQRRLDAAVTSWANQGWALESQTAGSTILRRGSELMVVSIDDKGQISTRPVTSS
jgi:beta-lactamase regulating signal transducer with metallopeptidase domain